MWSVSWKGGELVECDFLPQTQKRLLLLSLYALRESYAHTGWELETPEKAEEEITDGNLFVFVGNKIICLSECKPWFSAERVLTEEFVDEGIDLATVVQVMRAAASVMDVNRFTVGTRAAANQRHAGLAHLYKREGLTVSTVELVGVINEQEDQEAGSQV